LIGYLVDLMSIDHRGEGQSGMAPRLGVNIDHVATLRQARGGREPDPVWAAVLAELGGADGITVHLREDRRHIQDRDLRLLRETVQVRLNLELALDPAIVALAVQVRPDQVTFVPERRAELTTEGGLDVAGQLERVRAAVAQCRAAGLEVSLFIAADPAQVEAAVRAGAGAVELHTGRYAGAVAPAERARELGALTLAGSAAVAAGLALHAGHGLTYQNVGPVALIAEMAELNIGHSLVARAVFVGLERAVRDMKACLEAARTSTFA
jgi:pyridoxine 5-phosphate synthase